ncbi:beta strand repeat-containing protein [Hymenobacter sp. BRD67]|uniref:beta strand repeat-containing protein n=1 Tax=Hymenobacter sp. BRD67 TaxID=2675877 RepID=UPI001565D1D8|nr:hypothetical protein [Hymenobacter sp. BRD67]QKG53134.1 hypothetical protein GKZ67_11665 [Hymenobacter sp. BRD67]
MTTVALTKNGLSSSTGAGTFKGSSWSQATSPDAGKYIGFSVTPNTGYALTLSSLSYGLVSSGSGPATYQWYSSLDNFTTPLATVASTAAPANTTLTLPAASFGNLTSTISFRLYGYGATASTGTGGLLGDLVVNGSVAATSAAVLTATPTTLTGFSAPLGTASAAQAYKLAGNNLPPDGSLRVSLPVNSGFEVSGDNTSFGQSLTLAYAGTSLPADAAAPLVYVRLAATAAAGPYSGVSITTTVFDKTASATGTAATVSASGTVSAPKAAKPTTQPTITAANSTANTVDITLTGGNGQKRLVVLRATSATAAVPADNVTYPASLTLGAGGQPGPGNFVMVADGTTVAATLTGLSASVSYTLAVYAYNDDGVAGQESYLTASPGTATFSTTAGTAFYYSKPTGDLNNLATFGTATDGTGTAPGNFTTANRTYIVNGIHSLSGNLVVSGTSSKVVLAAGSAFTIPAAFSYGGRVDMQDGAYLTVLSPSPALNLGDLAPGSTVEFAQAANYVVPSPSPGYGHLKLTNATKQLAPGSTNIYGNLTLENVSSFGGSNTTTFSDIALNGNLNLLGATTFDPASSGRITLGLYGNTPQVLSGNGNTLRLHLLRTYVSGAGAVLADANGGTPLEVGTTRGGGLGLLAGSTLTLNANTLSFTPGGRASLVNSGGTGTITLSPASSLNLESLNTSIGSLYLTPGANTLNNLRLANASNDYLDVSSSLTIAGALTLDGTGRLDIGPNQTLTLTGTLTGTGSLQGSATSDLVIGGSGALGTLRLAAGTQQLRNLSIGRASGSVLLGSPVQVGGVLTMSEGTVTTTSTNLLTMSSTATLTPGNGFVSGPLARVTAPGARTTIFPVGSGTAYRPVTLTATTQTSTTTYMAEQKESPPTQSLTVNDPRGADLRRVSFRRYFTVTPTVQPTGFNGTITLSFGPDDYVNVPNDAGLVIAKRASPAAAWANLGHSAETGSSGTGPGGPPVSGTITSASFTSFSDFTLGATNTNNLTATQVNPLPVMLTSFTAARTAADVHLRWATASETNSTHFIVERSLAGQQFEPVSRAAAAGTTPTRIPIRCLMQWLRWLLFTIGCGSSTTTARPIFRRLSP